MKAIEYVKWVGKALAAAGLAATAALVAGYSDGELTKPEVWVAIGAAVPAGLAVFGIRNGDKPVSGPSDEEIEHLYDTYDY